jgi:Flp pilus assembly protein TadG
MNKARFFLPLEVFQNRAICALIRRNCGLAKDCAGTVAIEFALVLPLLFAILIGIIQYSLIFNNISVLTNAAAAGALVFSQGRSLPSSAPYSATVTQIQSAAASLVQANLTITTSVQGAGCASDSGCLTLLRSAYPGGSASVTVTYPCPLILSAAGLSWLGINTTFCPLTSTVTEYVM